MAAGRPRGKRNGVVKCAVTSVVASGLRTHATSDGPGEGGRAGEHEDSNFALRQTTQAQTQISPARLRQLANIVICLAKPRHTWHMAPVTVETGTHEGSSPRASNAHGHWQ